MSHAYARLDVRPHRRRQIVFDDIEELRFNLFAAEARPPDLLAHGTLEGHDRHSRAQAARGEWLRPACQTATPAAGEIWTMHELIGQHIGPFWRLEKFRNKKGDFSASGSRFGNPLRHGPLIIDEFCGAKRAQPALTFHCSAKATRRWRNPLRLTTTVSSLDTGHEKRRGYCGTYRGRTQSGTTPFRFKDAPGFRIGENPMTRACFWCFMESWIMQAVPPTKGELDALTYRTIFERVCQAKNGFHLCWRITVARGVMG